MLPNLADTAMYWVLSFYKSQRCTTNKLRLNLCMTQAQRWILVPLGCPLAEVIKHWQEVLLVQIEMSE